MRLAAGVSGEVGRPARPAPGGMEARWKRLWSQPAERLSGELVAVLIAGWVTISVDFRNQSTTSVTGGMIQPAEAPDADDWTVAEAVVDGRVGAGTRALASSVTGGA